MKSIKKILYSIFAISFFNIVLIKNFVYANPIAIPREIEVIDYSPLAIIILIAIVVGISILILRKIYKSNQLEKDKENEKEVEK